MEPLFEPSTLARERKAMHPLAFTLIVWRGHGLRTAWCAAGFNTPLWQEAVAAEYPAHLLGERKDG